MVRPRRSTDEQRLLYRLLKGQRGLMKPAGSTGEKLFLGQKGGLRLTGTKRGSGSTGHMGVERDERFLSTKNKPIRPVRPLFFGDCRLEVMKLYINALYTSKASNIGSTGVPELPGWV